MPIAFVAVGPTAAVVLLVAFGLLNKLTLSALVEAVTRGGTMRFGTTNYGRIEIDHAQQTRKVADRLHERLDPDWLHARSTLRYAPGEATVNQR